MITIVDYGLGNLQAFSSIYKRLGIPFSFAKNADELSKATHIILPGVGAFDWAMERLNSSGMRSKLDQLVLQENRFVLGICVGMQMMAKCSNEGIADGLGWFDAEVKRFDTVSIQEKTNLPHMGWNDVRAKDNIGLFNKIEKEARFYFLHSYYFSPRDYADILGETDYGVRFVCAVRRNHIFGVQFHPEKSHGSGIQLLKNFAEL
jgi:glutamine amidotransferase